VIVWKLGRLSGPLRDLVTVVAGLAQRGVELHWLRESLDTTTAAGDLAFHVFAVLAELKADVLRERTRAGLEAARNSGSKLCCPQSLSQVEMARTLISNPALSGREGADHLGVHRSTLSRSLGSTR
jgi:DNA invertase Pin-like site-specific DNA recombinase